MIKRNELKGPSCLTNAAEDEPIFVLRSSDEIAPLMVRIWAMNYRKQKSAQQGGMTAHQQAKYIEALNLADAMDAYRLKMTGKAPNGATLAMHPIESIDSVLVDGQQQHARAVNMPQTSDEAELMVKLGMTWLEANDRSKLSKRSASMELVCKLASELCNSIDAAEEDVGGHRPASEILKQLGPACDQWEDR